MKSQARPSHNRLACSGFEPHPELTGDSEVPQFRDTHVTAITDSGPSDRAILHKGCALPMLIH